MQKNAFVSAWLDAFPWESPTYSSDPWYPKPTEGRKTPRSERVDLPETLNPMKFTSSDPSMLNFWRKPPHSKQNGRLRYFTPKFEAPSRFESLLDWRRLGRLNPRTRFFPSSVDLPIRRMRALVGFEPMKNSKLIHQAGGFPSQLPLQHIVRLKRIKVW